jgi:hypothetical protein
MSSKRNQRAKQCTGKQKLDKTTAITTSRRMTQKGERGYGYYKCKFCGYYHTGHYPRKNRPSILKKIKEEKL